MVPRDLLKVRLITEAVLHPHEFCDNLRDHARAAGLEEKNRVESQHIEFFNRRNLVVKQARVDARCGDWLPAKRGAKVGECAGDFRRWLAKIDGCVIVDFMERGLGHERELFQPWRGRSSR